MADDNNNGMWQRIKRKLSRTDASKALKAPPEIYNWTLYASVCVFGVLGSARGYDEGNISGSVAQVSFKKQFGLSGAGKTEDEVASLKSNITSMVQLGAIGGALLAMYTVDRFGRIRALQYVCIIWTIAAIIQITASSVGQLYAGRLIEGLAIGQTTTIGPAYMSEVAPKQIRGLCNCVFAGAVYFGIMLAYFANYGTSIHISNSSRKQWVAPTSVKLVLAGLIFILSFLFCYESPRWLIKVGKTEKARDNLSKLRRLPRDHVYLIGEFRDVTESIIVEQQAVDSTRGVFAKIKEILFVKSIRYRFFVLAAAAQILGQWSGSNAITIYAPELFEFAGNRGHDILKMTAVLGVVKFVSAYLGAFFVIDFLGRRKAMYIGVSLQLVTILYFAVFLTIVPQATDESAHLTASQSQASKAAMAALFLSGSGWTIGFNSIQYLVGSEIFPLNIRSFAQSAIMVLHFANQYGNSKAVPKMLIALHPYGAFYFFTAIMVLALLWAWFFLPEISGRSLESMEELFSLPWYLVGRRGPQLCPDFSEINTLSYNHQENNGDIEFSEKMKNQTPQEFVENTNRKDLEKGV